MFDEFLAQLHNDMDDIEADYDFIDKDIVKFAAWVGQNFLGFEPTQLINHLLLYADETLGTVLGYFDENRDIVTIITCWYEKPAKGTVKISNDRIASLFSLWERLKNRELDVTEAGEELLFKLEDKGLAWDIVHCIYTNTEFSMDTQKEALARKIQLKGLGQLKDDYIQARHPLHIQEPETLEFTLSSESAFVQSLKTEGNDLEATSTIICALPLHCIYEWVKQYGNGLFTDNQRLRLSGYDKENAVLLEGEIKKTIKDTPERMFIQNNGMTITCNKLEPQSLTQVWQVNQSETVVKMFHPQIVNGCQTSWAIFSAFTESDGDFSSLKTGYIVAKIIETNDATLSKKIAESSNTQNAILPRDQKSNDKSQIEISHELASYGGNKLGVYWDYLRGGWSTVEAKGETSKYTIKGKTRRELKNGEAGQVMLAMIGAVHDAKNNASKIFTVDKLYQMAFGYELAVDERFVGLNNPLVSSGTSKALSTAVDDILFGFAIYQYARAAFQELYAARIRRLKNMKETEAQKNSNALSTHEFVKYWAFDVVRLTHLIVEKWALRPGIERKYVRELLIGNLTMEKYLNQIFLSYKKMSEWFNMELDMSRANTLDSDNPSQELPTLGKWFKNLEEMVGAEVLIPLEQNERVSYQNLILKRNSTHDALVKKLDSLLQSASWTDLFPITN